MKKAGKNKGQSEYKVIRKEERELKRSQKSWNAAGKPLDKNNPFWVRYTEARFSLQRIVRKKNMRTILPNNSLMHASNLICERLSFLQTTPSQEGWTLNSY